MSKIAKRSHEQVRDGYLGDLPEDIQVMIQEIHRIIKNELENMLHDRQYENINNYQYDDMINTFLTMPMDKNKVGSVRVYKNGNRYSCMIQMTGHVENDMNNDIGRNFHNFILKLYKSVKNKIRRQFKVSLTNESDGEPFEGFDIWTKHDTAKEIWNKFEDMTTKTFKEIDHMTESTENINSYFFVECDDLPGGLIQDIYECKYRIIDNILELLPKTLYEYSMNNNLLESTFNNTIDYILEYILESDESGATTLNPYSGKILITPEIYFDDHTFNTLLESIAINEVNNYNNPNRELVYDKFTHAFEFKLNEDYANNLYCYLEANPSNKKLLTKAMKLVNDVEKSKNKENKEEEEKQLELKKTKEIDNNLKKFKEKFRYNDAKGTITVNGKEYKCDLDVYNPVYKFNDQVKIPRATMATLKKGKSIKFDPVIVIARDQLQDKQFKYIDAIVQHEIGHLANGDLDVLPFLTGYKQNKNLAHRANKYLTKKNLAKYMDKRTAHSTTDEFGADMYARARTNKDDMFNALDVLYGDYDYNKGKYGYKNIERAVDISKVLGKDISKELGDLYPYYARYRYNELSPWKRKSMSFNTYEMINHKSLKSEYDKYDKNKLYLLLLRNVYQEIDADKNSRHKVLNDEKYQKYNAFQESASQSKVIAALFKSFKNGKISSGDLSTVSNIISHDYLPSWTKDFNKIVIDVIPKEKRVLFKINELSRDANMKLVNGKLTFEDYLKSNKIITILMSKDVLTSFTNSQEFIKFIHKAFIYYTKKLPSYADDLIIDLMNLKAANKSLLSKAEFNTVLNRLFGQLLAFTDVRVNKENLFEKGLKETIKTSNLIKFLHTKKKLNPSDKAKLLSYWNKEIQTMKESNNIENIPEVRQFMENYVNGEYDELMNQAMNTWCESLVDNSNNIDNEVEYMKEWFSVKKLKKIPRDLVAYISIEAESIKSNSDKMMIASYCLGKIEIVEWMIQLLESNSKKYVVPHTKPELERIRTELLQCYKKIMDTKIVDKEDQYVFRVKYPNDYQG